MKQLAFFTLFCLSCTLSSAQTEEFKIYSNGLMYSDTTMKQLEHVVDSLNLKFSSCELNKTYYSKYQAKAHYIELKKGNIQEAKEDLASNMPFEDFVKKYPRSTIIKESVIIKYQYRNYEDTHVVQFKDILSQIRIDVEERPEIYHQPVKETWIIDHRGKSEYADESIRGFYFTSEFEKQPLPEKYARMVQYSDCMVDTSTQIHIVSPYLHESDDSSEVQRFMAYVDKKTHKDKPEYDRDNYKEYRVKYETWDSLRMLHIENVLSKEDKFSRLLRIAAAKALESGGSSDRFEVYVAQFFSKEAALELKRRRVVHGSCSMDNSPRIHAMNIAVLSAETANWEVFLRAHLNIMNDRFSRASDGSYAWAGRQTYIKELEELEINVADLLLGISFRMENPSQNHYYGDIGRIGRALSETKFLDEIETQLLEIIGDSSLDGYNRIIMYYLFENYNYCLGDEVRKEQNLEKLQKAAETLPSYLATRIKD